jgi:hypothetical protein
VQRKILLVLAILVPVLLVAAALLWQRPLRPAPAAGPPDENAAEPLVAEMACIDRVLQNRSLKAEEVQPALDRCRSGRNAAN